ncbi:MAG: polysaccharide pyruvyl transferase family protein [Granulosicoccus sp.]
MMLKPLRVLHVASFHGNIGDNANHLGFRPWFQNQLGHLVEWTSLEIREFYWNERQWDDSFIATANAHDVVIIGGGNYFELWVENSPTGTSVAITPETFAKINVPVFFNALGVDPGQGVPDVSLARFKGFLNTLLADQRFLVSVRNDGAHGNLRHYVGEEYAGRVHRVPDGGFFVPPQVAASKQADAYRLGINIASDMPEFRFRGFASDDGIQGFVREFASVIEKLLQTCPDTEIVLFPHIFRDLEIISLLINHLPDRLRRTQLSVASYGSGDRAALETLAIYASCDLVLAMRFHANVCPIGMGIQTLGLDCYPQIANLYKELNQDERAIDVSHPGFVEPLFDASLNALTAPEKFQSSPAEAIRTVELLRESFEPVFKSWLDQNDLIN